MVVVMMIIMIVIRMMVMMRIKIATVMKVHAHTNIRFIFFSSTAIPFALPF